MKRSNFGSWLFGLAAAFIIVGTQATEPVASATQPSDDDGPIPAAPQQAQAPAAATANLARTERAKTSVTPAPSPLDTTGACPAGMVEVEGDYCPYIEQKCLRWLDPEQKMRCAEFAPTGKCAGNTLHKKFCIDRFEYPNKPGEKPIIMKTWYEARDTCKSLGKRLCGESEWTLACEGQERLPYPYGYQRNAEACNIDKPHPDVNEKALADPRTRDAEVERLWQGEPSGSREACVSPFGVHDMTGNVDEWVVNESGKPYQSGLKGGYWGPVRTRCRPMTTAHGEDFSFYQIGFRCCGDVPTAAAPQNAAKARPASVGKPAANPNPVLTGT